MPRCRPFFTGGDVVIEFQRGLWLVVDVEDMKLAEVNADQV